jgi:hypothetical protein
LRVVQIVTPGLRDMSRNAKYRAYLAKFGDMAVPRR